jgi:hypothetical protein
MARKRTGSAFSSKIYSNNHKDLKSYRKEKADLVFRSIFTSPKEEPGPSLK